MVQITAKEPAASNDETLQPPPELGAFIYLLGAAAVIGGFLFGYDTGVVSSAMLFLPTAMGLNYLWQELIVSVTLVGCALFSLVAGAVADRVGRRPVILAASGMFAVGAAVMAAAQERYMLLGGRLIVGAALGFASMVVPIYVSECCPVHIRGFMGTGFNLMVTFGQFSAALLGACFSYIDPIRIGWRLMLGFAAVPAVTQLVCFLFLPETPRFLATHGRQTDARRVLGRIYAGDEAWVEREMTEILHFEQQNNAEKDSRPTIVRIFQTPHVLRALLVGCSIQIFQQLSGINPVMYYTATIVKMGGIRDPSLAIWMAAAIAAVNFVFTIPPIILVERLGRRKLLLGSMIGTIVGLIILGIGFLLVNKDSAQIDQLLSSTQNLTGAELDDFRACRRLTNCDDCVTRETCGFCFASGAEQNASWCLPTDAGGPSVSLVGACSDADVVGFTWANNWCSSDYSWLPIIGMVLYLCLFAVGMGPLSWLYNSEIYPNWARSTGASISTASNWTFNTAISLTFLSLTELVGKYGVFFVYAAISVLGLVVFYFFVPETKGLPIEEVELLFMNANQRRRFEKERRGRSFQGDAAQKVATIMN